MTQTDPNPTTADVEPAATDTLATTLFEEGSILDRTLSAVTTQTPPAPAAMSPSPSPKMWAWIRATTLFVLASIRVTSCAAQPGAHTDPKPAANALQGSFTGIVAITRLVRGSIRWIEFFGEFDTQTEPYAETCQSGARGPPTPISAITLGRSASIGCRTAESGFAGVGIGETIGAEVATLFGC